MRACACSLTKGIQMHQLCTSLKCMGELDKAARLQRDQLCALAALAAGEQRAPAARQLRIVAPQAAAGDALVAPLQSNLQALPDSPQLLKGRIWREATAACSVLLYGGSQAARDAVPMLSSLQGCKSSGIVRLHSNLANASSQFAAGTGMLRCEDGSAGRRRVRRGGERSLLRQTAAPPRPCPALPAPRRPPAARTGKWQVKVQLIVPCNPGKPTIEVSPVTAASALPIDLRVMWTNITEWYCRAAQTSERPASQRAHAPRLQSQAWSLCQAHQPPQMRLWQTESCEAGCKSSVMPVDTPSLQHGNCYVITICCLQKAHRLTHLSHANQAPRCVWE